MGIYNAYEILIEYIYIYILCECVFFTPGSDAVNFCDGYQDYWCPN